MKEIEDVLNLERNDLEKLSDEELLDLYHATQDKGDELFILQISLKTLINSLYGAQGNKSFILANEKVAQAITGNGRYFIKSFGRRIEKHLQSLIKWNKPYYIYSDTDSAYYTIEPFVDEFLKAHPDATLSEIVDFCDKFENKVVEPRIQENIDEFCYKLNALDKSKCGAKKEIVADRMLLLKKKKYLCRLRENEATIFPEDSPKTKAMGVELIKSSTPKFSIKYMSEALPILFDGTENELRAWFEKCKTQFLKADISDIAAVTTVNCIDYNLRKDVGIPQNSRASILYNEFIKRNKLESSFNLIQAGDKVKYVFLKTPNPLGETIKVSSGKTTKLVKPNVIAFLDDNFIKYVKDYIDYDTQFEKTFIKPLEFMTNAINFTVKEKALDLFDF